MIRVAPAEAEKPHSSEIQVKVVNALRRSSGASDRTMSARKSLINLHRFTQDVSRWQKDRPPLFETNKNLGVLISLLLGEIEEVLKHRELEGLEGYNPKLEEKEMVFQKR